MPRVPPADRRAHRGAPGRPPEREGRLRAAVTRSTTAPTRELRPFDTAAFRSRRRNRVRARWPARGGGGELRQVPHDPVVPAGAACLRRPATRTRTRARSARRARRATARSRPSPTRAAGSTTRRRSSSWPAPTAPWSARGATSTRQFTGLRFASCTDCHKSPHRQALGAATAPSATATTPGARRRSTTREPPSRCEAGTTPSPAPAATAARPYRCASSSAAAPPATRTSTAVSSRRTARRATRRRASARCRSIMRRAPDSP